MLKRRRLNDQSGMAIFEIIPIFAIVVILLNFTIGFFTVIHTAILTSISSRNYTFETFRHRPSLNYFRDSGVGSTFYHEQEVRWHGTIGEQRPKGNVLWFAVVRDIAYVKGQAGLDQDRGSPAEHGASLSQIKPGERIEGSEGFSPVWIQPTYGMCLNFKCGRDE